MRWPNFVQLWGWSIPGRKSELVVLVLQGNHPCSFTGCVGLPPLAAAGFTDISCGLKFQWEITCDFQINAEQPCSLPFPSAFHCQGFRTDKYIRLLLGFCIAHVLMSSGTNYLPQQAEGQKLLLPWGPQLHSNREAEHLLCTRAQPCSEGSPAHLGLTMAEAWRPKPLAGGQGGNPEGLKSWVDVCCRYGRSHLKDPSTSPMEKRAKSLP